MAVELSASTAHRERVFLEDRLKTIKADLNAASMQLSDFSSKNVALDIKEQGKAMIEGAATLEGQLIATQSELKGLEQLYTDENPRVMAVRARIAELQRAPTNLVKTARTGDILASESCRGLGFVTPTFTAKLRRKKPFTTC